MGKLVLKNASVTVNSVDLSNHCSKVTISTSFNSVDMTCFGSTYKEIAQGIGDASITITVHQDYAASSVDATLWPLSQSGSVFPIVVKASSATVSSTNPTYTMNGVLLSYNPIDGAVGDALTTDVQFSCGDASGVARATA